MAFALSTTSLTSLATRPPGVDPKLIAVAKLAITLSSVDFGFRGIQARTEGDEAELVAEHKSQTMHSHHVIGQFGEGQFGGACDAIAFVAGQPAWDPPDLYYAIASAMFRAADQLSTVITWGGCFDRTSAQIMGGTPADMKIAHEGYMSRGHTFVDLPHFELGAN